MVYDALKTDNAGKDASYEEAVSVSDEMRLHQLKMAHPDRDVELIYQKVIVELAHDGLKKGRVALVLAHKYGKSEYRVIRGGDSRYDTINTNSRYELVTVFDAKNGLPRYTDIDEALCLFERDRRLKMEIELINDT